MKKRILVSVLLLGWVLGCASLGGIEEREKIYGKAAPVITASFASKELRPGDTWKIYLQASDPDGDMKQISCQLFQPGMEEYFPRFLKIQEENAKELSGYISLNFQGQSGLGDLISAYPILTVQIQDKAGHYSEPVRFSITFNPRSTQEPPPAGIFKEQNLGLAMIRLGISD